MKHILHHLQRLRKNGLVTAGALLFISTTVVNIGNYGFNLVLGRWLGPAAFADLSLIVTLMLVVSFATSALSMVTAKFAATYAAADGAYLAGLRRWLGLRAWLLGAVLMGALVLGAPLLSSFFHSESAWPFVILGLGMPMFLAQAVDRGVLQGQTRFGLLALSYQAEMWVRLIAAIGFVALGFSVAGAVGGLTLSFIATWLVARRVAVALPGSGELPRVERNAALQFAGPASVALLSQILINNSDVLIVKRFFSPEDAGHYAALALIGRIVFFATWSVVTVTFPIVAQKHQKGEPHRHLLGAGLGLVALVSVGIIGATLVAPTLIVELLFGAPYLPIAPLLWLYALATAFYALANVVISYRLSIGASGGSVIAIIAGVAQVAALWVWHDTLAEVVLVQVAIMAALLVVLLVWDMLNMLVGQRHSYAPAATK